MTDRFTLDRWLEGTGPEHPVRREIRLGGMDDYLDELERLLTTLERAAPTRLAGKRRDFRGLTDRERWRDLLSELLVARWSVCQGVGFDFGGLGTAQPDLVLPEYDFGIEVTRRSRDGAVALRRSLYRGLASVTPRPQPVVTLSAQPLAIREGILAQINAEALTTLRSGGVTFMQWSDLREMDTQPRLRTSTCSAALPPTQRFDTPHRRHRSP